jgi:hypothetical protein
LTPSPALVTLAVVEAARPFPCDCCGHRTFAAAPDGESLQLCPVCGWEDSEYWGGGELALDLLVAQPTYAATGAAVPLLRDQVRAPTAAEARDPRWQPYEGRRAALLARVEVAFAHVRLRRGRSPTEAIRDAKLVDNYGAEYDPPPPPGRWHPPDAHHWQDLTPAGVLALFSGSGGLCFMHGDDLRFFLPAMARLYLQEQAAAAAHDGPWLPLFHFASIDERRAADLAGYDDVQRQWLAELFAFATRPGTAGSRRRNLRTGERAAWRDHWLPLVSADYLAIYGSA